MDNSLRWSFVRVFKPHPLTRREFPEIKDGHWLLENAPLEARPLHYVAGGHWYATGEAVTLPQYGND